MLAFALVDCVEGVAKVWCVSLFHFHEHEAAFFLGNDIYLAKSGSEIFFKDCVSFLFQGLYSPFFAFFSFFLFSRQSIPSRP
ncbi:MAG: hypothetical protein H6Q53_1313 [Deltaproteobacteria bacterium]|nr:hypothetical protein [Deltaproteobacteria bacterium]